MITLTKRKASGVIEGGSKSSKNEQKIADPVDPPSH